MEVRRPTHDGTVDEEELALEPVRQGAADRRLARAGWARQEHAALRFEIQLLGQLRVLERKNDVCLECIEHVVQTLQILELHRLHFAEVDVARHVMLAQIRDESIRIERGLVAQRDAGIANLARVELGAEAVDLAHIEHGRAVGAEIGCAQRRVVVGRERRDADHRHALVQSRNRHPFTREHQRLVAVAREGDEWHECRAEEVLPWVRVRAAGDERDEVEIVDDHGLMSVQRSGEDGVRRLVERQRVTLGGGLDELTAREERAAQAGVQGMQDRRLAGARAAHEHGDAVRCSGALEVLERFLLSRQQRVFG